MELKYLNSLRGRYAVVTLLLSAFLLTGSFIAQYNLTKSRDTAASNINTRNELLRNSRHIRTTIRKHYESLVLFLLMPSKQKSPKYMHETIEQTAIYTKQLLEHGPSTMKYLSTVFLLPTGRKSMLPKL